VKFDGSDAPFGRAIVFEPDWSWFFSAHGGADLEGLRADGKRQRALWMDGRCGWTGVVDGRALWMEQVAEGRRNDGRSFFRRQPRRAMFPICLIAMAGTFSLVWSCLARKIGIFQARISCTFRPRPARY